MLCWHGCRAVPALRRGHHHSRAATIWAVDGCGAAWVGASGDQAVAPAAASVVGKLGIERRVFLRQTRPGDGGKVAARQRLEAQCGRPSTATAPRTPAR
jgi:hypothetical protein